MRNRTITALAAAATLAVAAPGSADAGTRFVVKGAGYGHGVGMSQYGAFGLARHGRSYKRILRHYYRRTEVRRGRSRSVKVLLESGLGSVSFKGARKACGKGLRRKRRYSFAPGRSGIVLRRGGKRIARCGKAGAASARKSVKAIGIGRYRGKLIGRRSGGSVSAINKVGIEGYTRGVVANEVPSSWPKHALRAQAVAARSYALATAVDGDGYDLYDDTRSQVYGGKGSETGPTNRAARRTRREVVEHRGKVAVTYFFSTSGGETENVEYGFQGSEPRPYLKAVRDPYDGASPYHRWRVKYSRAELESRLGGLVEGRLRRIEVLKRGASPRVVKARVVGSRGREKVSGETLRVQLGLRSTWMRFRKKRR